MDFKVAVREWQDASYIAKGREANLVSFVRIVLAEVVLDFNELSVENRFAIKAALKFRINMADEGVSIKIGWLKFRKTGEAIGRGYLNGRMQDVRRVKEFLRDGVAKKLSIDPKKVLVTFDPALYQEL